MLNYFRELKAILTEILALLKEIDGNLKNLSDCVKISGRHYGDRKSISTKHWNH